MNEDQIKAMFVDAVRAASAGSSRSKQTEVGPSELGGCRRRTWLRLNGQKPTNRDTLNLASWMGTALHDQIESVVRSWIDPFDSNLMTEVEVEAHGIRGHVDLYDPQEGLVVDWKTTSKKNLSYFPSKQQRWQVQVYGLLLAENGHDVKQVALVAIPRDGNERDIVVHTESFDRDVALEALSWLEDIKRMDEPPAAEKEPSFCRDYCPFFGACEGQVGKPADIALTDSEGLEVAREYLNTRMESQRLRDRLEALKEALEGVQGQSSDGIYVAWSERTSSTVDRDAVRAAMGDVPMKTGTPSRVLTVKQK